MIHKKLLAAAMIAAAFGLNLDANGQLGMSSAHAQAAPAVPETARAEVAKPLVAAQELLKEKKYPEALAKLSETDPVPSKTPYETYIIERVRASIAVASGDNELAIKSLPLVIASGRLAADEQIQFGRALAGLYYAKKDYPNAIIWFSRSLKEGGEDRDTHSALIRSYFLNNEFTRASDELKSVIQTDEKAGKAPEEEQLRLLATCAQHLKDDAGFVLAIEKLAAYYPKKDYWVELLNRVISKPAFSDRLALDVFRLRLATGQLNTANAYTMMAQLAMQAGFPAEAKKVLEQGFQAGLLGTGPEAAQHKRLRDQANKAASDDVKTMLQGEAEGAKSKDGTGLVNLGYAYISAGQFDKGVALLEQGINKGGIKRIDDARLHAGIGYLNAGRQDKAVQMFNTVQGTDGTADLAHLWAILAKQAAK